MGKGHTQLEFIQKVTEIHNAWYDYTKVEYSNLNSRITIICPLHGEFIQVAKQHLTLKRGCRKCGDKKCAKNNSVSVDYFIQKAREIHGDKYDYSQVSFDNYKNKITIICKKHGPFVQRLSKHLYDKQGCKKCVIETEKFSNFTRTRWVNITKETGAYLYLYKFESEFEIFYKVGITKNLNNRFQCKGVKFYKRDLILVVFSYKVANIFDTEKIIHRKLKPYKYLPLEKFDGRHECYQAEDVIIDTFIKVTSEYEEQANRIN